MKLNKLTLNNIIALPCVVKFRFNDFGDGISQLVKMVKECRKLGKIMTEKEILKLLDQHGKIEYHLEELYLLFQKGG